MKKYLKYLILILFIIPLNINAEEFYNGSYITYYQDSNLTTQHLGAYGIYFVNGTAYNTNTSNFRDTWFYTTHLDTSAIQGGSIYIPFSLSYVPQESGFTDQYGQITETCIRYTCATSANGVCTEYRCAEVSSGTNSTIDDEFYEANKTLIVRCYYNGTTTFVPGRIEGSNVVCPVQTNATYLAGIRLFHRVIGKSTFSYQLGLASGITTYNNATSQIIEQQQQTNNNLTDSSTNTNTENQNQISAFENNIATNGTIQSLFVMPIKLWQNVINGIGGTCQPFYLGDLFEEPITLQCVNLENVLGSTLWHTIDVIICMFFIWFMSKRFISIFEKFTSMKDGKDEVGD